MEVTTSILNKQEVYVIRQKVIDGLKVDKSIKDQISDLIVELNHEGKTVNTSDQALLRELVKIKVRQNQLDAILDRAFALQDDENYLKIGRQRNAATTAERNILRDLRLTRMTKVGSVEKVHDAQKKLRAANDWDGLL